MAKKTKNPEYAIALNELKRSSKQVYLATQKKLTATRNRYVKLEAEISQLEKKRKKFEEEIDRCNELLDKAIDARDQAKSNVHTTPQYLED